MSKLLSVWLRPAYLHNKFPFVNEFKIISIMIFIETDNATGILMISYFYTQMRKLIFDNDLNFPQLSIDL